LLTARAGLAVRADDADHVRALAGLGEHRLDALLDRGVAERAVLDVEHDLVAVARLGGERLLQQLERTGRLGAGQREAVVVLVAGRLAEAAEHEEAGDPEREHGKAVREAPASEGSHGCSER